MCVIALMFVDQSIEDEMIQSIRKTLVKALLDSCEGVEIIASNEEVFPKQPQDSVNSLSGSRLKFTSADASSKTDGRMLFCIIHLFQRGVV